MRSPARPSGTRASFLIASTLALLTPLTLMAWASGNSSPRIYTTALGESRRVVLGQHAVANLNTNSALTVEVTPETCDIVLKSGEALFDIRRDGLRTVRVTAGNSILHTEASTFAVRLHDADHIDVLVRKGAVVLVAPGAPQAANAADTGSAAPVITFTETLLTANRSAHVSLMGVSLKTLSGAEVVRRLEWTDGYLAFGGETLGEVAEEFNRYNPQRMVIDDPDLRRLRIGGKFQSTDPEGFARALRPMGVQRLDPHDADSRGETIRLVAVGNETR
jgi:transmembrane sensor